jgi:hypothetical protein
MNSSAPRKVHVVVHTHWDREWYFTHEVFCMRLVEVMRRVADQLESEKLPHFLLDGQVAAYEDFLSAAEPELVKRVQKLVAENRIGIGPWQVMADSFLVSGESLWRNLEMGLASARKHGGAQTTGYLPDTFGHVAQMPQLLKHFGIPCAAVWRGADSPAALFNWAAPDGSTLPSIYLSQGYYQIPLHETDWQGALERYLVEAERTAKNGPLLLMQGGDHLAPQADLAEKIAAFNAAQIRWTLEFTTLDGHAAEVTASQTARHAIAGELRSNANAFVLPDVLSTRRYLKRLHQELEDRLTGEIEPLLAQRCAPADFPWTALEQTWRRLLALQAHDSICGCSIDAVHGAMEVEFAQLRERMDVLRKQALFSGGLLTLDLAGPRDVFADDRSITLFNPLPKPVAGVHTLELFLQGEPAEALNVRAADGAEWPCAVLNTRSAHRFASPLDGFPDRRAGHLYEVALQGSLPGVGIAELQISPAAAQVSHSKFASLENARIAVELSGDGRLSLIHRASGARKEGVLDILSELDAGDTYNFSPPAKRHSTRGVRWTLCEAKDFGLVRQWILETEIQLPAGLDGERHGPASEEVTCEGTLRLRLLGDEPVLDAHFTWTNRAQDQRTRLLIPMDAGVDATFADSAFAWVRRSVTLAQIPDAPSRTEMPVAVLPSHSAIVAGSLGFCHRGMQEFEVMDLDGQRQLGITLVRSVGWLSRRDLLARGVGAGPDLETPGAQCLRTDEYDFQVGFVEPGTQGGIDWLKRAERFRKPVACYTGQASGWRDSIDIGNANLMVSAIRALPDAVEIRVWNPGDAPQSIGLSGDWARTDAHGQRVDNSRAIAPHAIATFRRKTS